MTPQQLWQIFTSDPRVGARPDTRRGTLWQDLSNTEQQAWQRVADAVRVRPADLPQS